MPGITIVSEIRNEVWIYILFAVYLVCIWLDKLNTASRDSSFT